MKIKIGKLGVFSFLILIGLQSCVVGSLHPFYDDANRYHIDSLDGVWLADDGETKIEITTIVDTTGLTEQEKNFQNIKKMKHKSGSKLKVKYKYNDSLINSNSYQEELQKLKGSDEERKEVLLQPKYDHKQIMYYFYPHSRKRYLIKYITKEETAVFTGILSKIKESYFLDIALNEDFIKDQVLNSSIMAFTYKMHICYMIKLVDNELHIHSINERDFKHLIKSRKIRIPYSIIDDQIIITAKTKDLQKFMLKLDETKYFEEQGDKGVFKRQK